jgi:hypothetical protein
MTDLKDIVARQIEACRTAFRSVGNTRAAQECDALLIKINQPGLADLADEILKPDPVVQQLAAQVAALPPEQQLEILDRYERSNFVTMYQAKLIAQLRAALRRRAARP